MSHSAQQRGFGNALRAVLDYVAPPPGQRAASGAAVDASVSTTTLLSSSLLSLSVLSVVIQLLNVRVTCFLAGAPNYGLGTVCLV